MRHIGSVAAREVQSLFVSPVAYVVLTLWAVLAGLMFLASLFAFQSQLVQAQQMGAFDYVRQLNLNDVLLAPFISTMWIIVIFAIPGVTMGLFASEKTNGTQELLMTSPLTIWDIVLGKFLAGAVFVLLLTAVVAFYPAILFIYGDPELGKTLSSLLAFLLVSLTYMAVGAFASSVTRNQLIAFFLSLVVLMALLMLPFFASQLGGAVGGGGSLFTDALRWLSTPIHVEQLLQGLVETKDLVHFVFMIGVFLLLTKMSVESVRWR